MNESLQQNYSRLVNAFALRDQILDVLTDDDLKIRLGGNTMSLGEILWEHSEIQDSYTQSFWTLRQEFVYRRADPEIVSSVARLRALFHTRDQELKDALERLTGKESVNRTRPLGVHLQLTMLREACIILAAKASVYLRALRRTLPPLVDNAVD